jgi:hypothetical protein
MSLVSLRQLLDHAAEHGYGMPAFNVNSMEILASSSRRRPRRRVRSVERALKRLGPRARPARSSRCHLTGWRTATARDSQCAPACRRLREPMTT